MNVNLKYHKPNVNKLCSAIFRTRIPLTVCPTTKMVQGLVAAFDENGDDTLTGREKAMMITTVATYPDVAVYK